MHPRLPDICCFFSSRKKKTTNQHTQTSFVVGPSVKNFINTSSDELVHLGCQKKKLQHGNRATNSRESNQRRLAKIFVGTRQRDDDGNGNFIFCAVSIVVIAVAAFELYVCVKIHYENSELFFFLNKLRHRSADDERQTT